MMMRDEDEFLSFQSSAVIFTRPPLRRDDPPDEADSDAKLDDSIGAGVDSMIGADSIGADSIGADSIGADSIGAVSIGADSVNSGASTGALSMIGSGVGSGVDSTMGSDDAISMGAS